MRDPATVAAAVVVAFGWVLGAALVAVAAIGDRLPRGWALREVPRRAALVAGLSLAAFSTAVFAAVEALL